MTILTPAITVSTRSLSMTPAAQVCCAIFFFQAEDGIRDTSVTGVQTCALPILWLTGPPPQARQAGLMPPANAEHAAGPPAGEEVNSRAGERPITNGADKEAGRAPEIGRASCRERVEVTVVGGAVKNVRDASDRE